jgi:DNA-binding MarR family transcriptional regulator
VITYESVNTQPDDVAAIRGGAGRLARRLRAERPEGALSGTKVGVLSHLYREGPSTPGVIAAAELQRPQSLTRTFHELQAQGLISRSRSRVDGRESVLTLTRTGRAALVRDLAGRDAWLAEALGTLTPAEAAILRVAATLMDQLAGS